MKILTAAQTRKADAYTIAHEPVASIDLMERAAAACVSWIEKKFNRAYSFLVFCGLGNNGGDGLAIARLLKRSGFKVQVFVVRHSNKASQDFLVNEKRLREIDPSIISDLINEKDF